MTIPASALSSMQYVMSGFHTIYPGDSGGYVGAIQSLMYGYSSSTRTDIARGGYIDEGYGTWSQSAVKTFQGDKNLTQDGIVGPSTWNHLAYEPSRLNNNTNLCIYGFGSINSLRLSGTDSYAVDEDTIWYYYTHTAAENNAGSVRFKQGDSRY